MTTKNNIKVIYVRSNEAFDIYQVIGYEINDYIEVRRGEGTTEEDIADRYL